MKTIQIIIDTNGQSRLETQGFTGQSCREASKQLEQSLGLVQSDTPSADLYQSVADQQALRQSNGG